MLAGLAEGGFQGFRPAMSKSRPLYGPLRCDPAGRRHLVVCQADPGAGLDTFQGGGMGPVEVWAVAENSSCVDRRFASPAEMLEEMVRRLRWETMGLRLYALGDEAFLWDVFGQASAAGMGRQEVRLSRLGVASRRVYCTHCSTMNPDVRTDLVACRGCGLTLAVRDHFSRRLSAFMGVNADAEAPGDRKSVV